MHDLKPLTEGERERERGRESSLARILILIWFQKLLKISGQEKSQTKGTHMT